MTLPEVHDFVIDNRHHVKVTRYKSAVGISVKCEVTGGGVYSYKDGLPFLDCAEDAVRQHLKYENDAAVYNRWKSVEAQALTEESEAGRFAEVALKASILVNGASAAAVLGFLAHLWTIDPKAPLVAVLVKALFSLSVGVLAGAIATGLGYLTVFFKTVDTAQVVKKGKSSKWVLIVAQGCQYIAFGLVIYTYYRFWDAITAIKTGLGG